MRGLRRRTPREGGPLTGAPIPPRFEHAAIEPKWQAHWESNGYFRAPERPTGRPFSIVLPPPNVTGVLTIGHMLGDTVQDLLIRHHRMRGDSVLWIPGVDHAGLATQVRVRQELERGGVDVEHLPREELLAHVERWKLEREARIREQEHLAGLALDWSRYRYTMDPGSIRATREVFVRLYNEGLIYRGERIVNWDPKLETAISDLEVVHTEETGELLYVRYPWADGSPGGLVVATVRPETIFGDVAVAVHPDDERHRAHVGRAVRVPLTDRTVPVIADAGVDPNFGNGALKITPRHDTLDFDIFRRHSALPMPPSILDPRGVLESDWVPERFRGLDRDPGRAAVARTLDAEGFVDKTESFRHSVARSERTGAVVEPTLSKQWFVRMAPLAPPAIDAVRKGEVVLRPERWTLSFFRWMEGIQDWCISRQVAWGHAIPVYTCAACGKELAAVDVPTNCPKCGNSDLHADPDVLDTWFSSWLWPFSTLGWPEPTAALSAYYPTSVLVTGRDIVFFWVARMMMAGYHFTGERPFSAVYFTGMLRDEQGRRMAKHLGNSPDPAEVIREWGADALRFALVFPNPVDQDGTFGTSTLEGARNFLTKLWNLVRFALPYFPEGTDPPAQAPDLTAESRIEDRWILSRWAATARDVDLAIAEYEFTKAATLLHGFLWHDVADQYVEIVKDRLQGRAGEPSAREARHTLLFVLERTLRQLHPFVPHVTEELWHSLPHHGDSLAVAPWPAPEEAARDPEVERDAEVLLGSIRALRNLRSEHHVPSKEEPPAWVRLTVAGTRDFLEREKGTIARLAKTAPLILLDPNAPPPPGTVTATLSVGEFFLRAPAGHPGHSPTLVRERDKLQKLLDKTRSRLADEEFRANAPPELVRDAESKAAELAERIGKIEASLARVGEEKSG